jgi:Na+/phosphate symporter
MISTLAVMAAGATLVIKSSEYTSGPSASRGIIIGSGLVTTVLGAGIASLIMALVYTPKKSRQQVREETFTWLAIIFGLGLLIMALVGYFQAEPWHSSYQPQPESTFVAPIFFTWFLAGAASFLLVPMLSFALFGDVLYKELPEKKEKTNDGFSV